MRIFTESLSNSTGNLTTSAFQISPIRLRAVVKAFRKFTARGGEEMFVRLHEERFINFIFQGMEV